MKVFTIYIALENKGPKKCFRLRLYDQTCG